MQLFYLPYLLQYVIWYAMYASSPGPSDWHVRNGGLRGLVGGTKGVFQVVLMLSDLLSDGFPR